MYFLVLLSESTAHTHITSSRNCFVENGRLMWKFKINYHPSDFLNWKYFFLYQLTIAIAKFEDKKKAEAADSSKSISTFETFKSMKREENDFFNVNLPFYAFKTEIEKRRRKKYINGQITLSLKHTNCSC